MCWNFAESCNCDYSIFLQLSTAITYSYLKGHNHTKLDFCKSTERIFVVNKLQVKSILYVVEVSLAITLNEANGANNKLGYEHTLTIQSPPTYFDVASCLELMYTAQSPFSVKLACLTFNGTYTELPLYSSRQPLGFTPHKLKLALPVTTSDYKNCALAFQVNTMTTGVVAAFSNVVVLPGQCPPAGY